MWVCCVSVCVWVCDPSSRCFATSTVELASELHGSPWGAAQCFKCPIPSLSSASLLAALSGLVSSLVCVKNAPVRPAWYKVLR